MSVSKCEVDIEENTLWPDPTVITPKLEELNRAMEYGICEATDGCRVEPDGVCEHGYPSWLIYLGVI